MKFADFDEIEIFQFLTYFTKIANVFLKIKLHFCAAPLWKAGKIYIFRGSNLFEPDEIIIAKSPFRFIAFIGWYFTKIYTITKIHCIITLLRTTADM